MSLKILQKATAESGNKTTSINSLITGVLLSYFFPLGFTLALYSGPLLTRSYVLRDTSDSFTFGFYLDSSTKAMVANDKHYQCLETLQNIKKDKEDTENLTYSEIICFSSLMERPSKKKFLRTLEKEIFFAKKPRMETNSSQKSLLWPQQT